METSTLEIVGREDELAAINAFLEPAAGSDAAALLIEGEPGIGKTSLCEAVLASARERGFKTLAARPVEAEAELALATIGDLLEPVLDEVLRGLPEPQARALRVALLLEEDSAAPEARALGVAVLGALRLLASAAPVLVVVDDVQWLDASSAAVIRFAARRVAADPIAFVFARRTGHSDDIVPALERVEHVFVGGLSVGALQRLVRDRLGLVLTRPALRRLHELSGGNPFYALELGGAFQRGTFRLERGEALPPTLEALVGQRLATLPRQTREALAAAAALSRPTMNLVGSPDVLAPALAANVIVSDGNELRFTHPLLASAAYGVLDLEQRCGLHRRLAHEVTDVEERARHLALGTQTPDPEVAATLDDAALIARRRGAAAAAVELAEQARRLTPPDDAAAVHRRVRAAAAYSFTAGDMPRATALLEGAIASAQAGADRAEALASLGRLCIYEGDLPRAAELTRQALEIPDASPVVRADASLALATALFFMRIDLDEAAARAHEVAQTADTAGAAWLAHARAIAALIETLRGQPLRPDALDFALGNWEVPFDRPQLIGDLQYDAAILCLWNDAIDDALSYLERAHRKALDDGNEAALALILVHLALVDCLTGRWDDARRQADAGYEKAIESRQRPQQALALAFRALVDALVGREEEARAAAARSFELAGDVAIAARIYSTWALGLLDLSLGAFDAVIARVPPLAERLERGGVREPQRFAADFVEALLGLGRVEEARVALATLQERAETADRPSARAAAYRCSGLAAAAESDLVAALEWFERALEQHARVPMPFERARTVLARASVLRRAKRKRDARAGLEEAATEFERLGAVLWARRARGELERIGGRTSAGEELTPTERKVVALVAEGLPNREVAAALFVTPKTVEFHLRNVFRKLGIRSRAELARRAP